MNPVLVATGVFAILMAALLLAEALVWAFAARTMDRVDEAEARRRRELIRALNTSLRITELERALHIGATKDRPRTWTDGGAS